MLDMDPGMAAAAARRIPLERPPSATDEAKVLRQQKQLRARVGQNLNRIRTEAGLSLRALSMRADISTNHLSRTEKGLHGVTIDFCGIGNVPVCRSGREELRQLGVEWRCTGR
jgi:ribosome-binding protein aMBF1 (putative translation factor)